MGREDTQKQLNDVVDSLGTSKFEAPTIAVDEIRARLKTGDKSLVLLDIRTDEERAVSSIEGAISKAEFDSSASGDYVEKQIVAFCTVGYCSAAEVAMYRKAGKSNVYNMGDGALLGYTLAETSEGNTTPLVKPDGSPTNEVHTFMPTLLPLAGDGMVGHSFADPGAVLTKANERYKLELGV